MAAQQVTPPAEQDSSARKRVCKACDRCRLKKSKCDGTTPCSRCKSDNAICVFGERKKSHDKVYPKGYVEMLEHQQVQLVNGLQELYKRATTGQGWDGPVLADCTGGRPLTHDILDSLGVLHQESLTSTGNFDDDLETLQQRLNGDGPDYLPQHDSSESEGDRESTRTSFYDLPVHQQSTNTFAVPQLPTPPVQHTSPPPSQTWQAPRKSNQFQPRSLQLTPVINNWNLNISEAELQAQTWVESPIPYVPSDFLQYNGFTDYENIQGPHPPLQRCGEQSNIAMPDWTEDDFNSFLTPTAS